MRLDYVALFNRMNELERNNVPVAELLNKRMLEVLFVDSGTLKNKDFTKVFFGDDIYLKYLYHFKTYFPIVGSSDMDSSVSIGLAFILFNPNTKTRDFVTFDSLKAKYLKA